MRILTKQNVLEAAYDRITYLYETFENVVVGFSGGKDSTAVLNLTIEVARKLNRLPVPVVFIDQEAEWETVIKYIRETGARKETDLFWLQVPIQISNATSSEEDWLQCWDPGKEWLREKEEHSLKENIYGTKTFNDIFGPILDHHWGPNSCYVSGVRCIESPTRAIGLTTQATFRHITWGKILNRKKNQFTFYPIYDWATADVWTAIARHEWSYCAIYDLMYQQGYGTNDMRVSNLHHSTAVKHLRFMSEIEPRTWAKLTERLHGVNTVKHLQGDINTVPKELPEAFETWKEYRDYLCENLITQEEHRETFRKQFAQDDKDYALMAHKNDMYHKHIRALLLNDYFMTTIKNWQRQPDVDSFRKWRDKGRIPPFINKYIPV